MKFNLEHWLKNYTETVKETFGSRIYFIGLQGSYGRGEATEDSDIDTVLILDKITAEDLSVYGKILDKMPYREKTCGFISGKAELFAWEKSELFQFINDTTPIYGTLENLLSDISKEDIESAVKTGACGIYHGTAHNLIHEKSIDILKSLYKSAMFTLRVIVYLEKGVFIRKQKDLPKYLSDKNRLITENRQYLNSNEISDKKFTELSDTLLKYSSSWITGE